jgi:hypothetical protein
MDSGRIHELVFRLKQLQNEARLIEQTLEELGLNPVPSLIDLGLVRQVSERLEALEEMRFALARVDFGDDGYKFIRAIDGDTIVVAPPRQLKRWMNDVHVRLYGLETPELSEELGPQYKDHLEELCSIDAGEKLTIVWERERLGTNYEGFPLANFERGIGHVFFRDARSGAYVYVNGLMHLLRFSSLLRKGRSLLRGRRVIEGINMTLAWSGPCPTPVTLQDVGRQSSTMSGILSLRPPACLLRYNHLPSLDPRKDGFPTAIHTRFKEVLGSECPITNELQRYASKISDDIARHRASPFDLSLAQISMWAEYQRQAPLP